VRGKKFHHSSKEQIKELGVPTIWQHDPKKNYLLVWVKVPKNLMHYHQTSAQLFIARAISERPVVNKQ